MDRWWATSASDGPSRNWNGGTFWRNFMTSSIINDHLLEPKIKGSKLNASYKYNDYSNH
jgi:hypothetical protein